MPPAAQRELCACRGSREQFRVDGDAVRTMHEFPHLSLVEHQAHVSLWPVGLGIRGDVGIGAVEDTAAWHVGVVVIVFQFLPFQNLRWLAQMIPVIRKAAMPHAPAPNTPL